MARQPWKTYGQVTQTVGGTGNATITDIFKKAFEIQREIDQAKRLEERGTLDKVNPYFTDLGSCPSKVALSLMNVPETNPPDTRALMTFHFGHCIEEGMADILDVVGAKTLREIRVESVYRDVTISGRVDFLTEIPDLFPDSLIELKSTSSMSMKFTLQGLEKGTPQIFHEKYLKQLGGYIWASQRGDLVVDGAPKTYDHGYLVYIVKDAKKGQEPMQAFRVAHDEAIERDLDVVVKAARMAYANLEVGIPAEYLLEKEKKGKPPIVCQYCPYFDYHWNQSKKESA